MSIFIGLEVLSLPKTFTYMSLAMSEVVTSESEVDWVV